MKTVLLGAMCAGLLAISAPSATASPIAFSVNINTTPLTVSPGSLSAPFYLDFQLNGTAGNTAIISFFNFGGGGAAGVPESPIGNATGDLATAVTLHDSASDVFNDFAQQFTPGSSLNFVVSLTSIGSGSPTPDSFSFAILDHNFAQIPTTGPDLLFNQMVTVDITTALSFRDVQTFSGTAPFGGVTVAASPVPEPASLVLVALGIVGLAARRRRSSSPRR